MSAGQMKKDEVTNLMGLLAKNLESEYLSEQQRDKVLGQLKVHSRDPNNADAIFCRDGIKTLASYSFGDYPPTTSREASRCIANALLLMPKLRQEFVDLELASEAAEKLRTQDDEEEFLMSRILFLLTYDTETDFVRLSKSHALTKSVEAHLHRHATQLSGRAETEPPGPMETMALSESLKLVFNLSNLHSFQKQEWNSASLIEAIFSIFNRFIVPNAPLQPPINYMINALANIEFHTNNSERSTSNAKALEFVSDDTLQKLVNILDQSLLSYTPVQLESLAIPLLTVLRKIYEMSGDENKKQMKQLLLPKDEGRNLPIGKSRDVSSRLLRLTTSTGLVNLSECISSLMFELSNKDANLYVKNVGYGYAAGYLVSHNIPVPESAKAYEKTASAEHSGVTINPITGQRLDKEPLDSGPPMTQEEKEREAERLFVLFERLNATGVMDVKNPVRQAMEEGKFDSRIEELDDSE